jgi:hypothetical protein
METLKATLDLIQENEATLAAELAWEAEPLHCLHYYHADDLKLYLLISDGSRNKTQLLAIRVINTWCRLVKLELGALEDVLGALCRQQQIPLGQIMPHKSILVSPAWHHCIINTMLGKRWILRRQFDPWVCRAYLLQDQEYLAAMPFPLRASSRLITSEQIAILVRHSTMTNSNNNRVSVATNLAGRGHVGRQGKPP